MEPGGGTRTWKESGGGTAWTGGRYWMFLENYGELLLGTIEVLVLAGGGLAGLYLYWANRRGEVTVAIQTSARLASDVKGLPVLLIALRIANPSRVLFRYAEATVTLMDASKRMPDGQRLLFVPFAQENPILPVYAQMTADPSEIYSGRLFVETDEEITLEPQESVDTEVAFPLEQKERELLAVKVALRGAGGRKGEPHWWSTFFFIDLAALRDAGPGKKLKLTPERNPFDAPD